MLIEGVLIFFTIAAVVSYWLGKFSNIDKGGLTAYGILIMSASFLWGLFIARFPR